MAARLPPGPGAPSAVQTMGWWVRPVAFFERNRARYGKRFTLRLLGQVPFVMVSDPDEVREVFTAPPEVLHPGEGARILEPTVGPHSLILLDERAHLEQRKLMLPAFHGERIDRLAALVEDVAERETAGWPLGEPVALHARLQALTLEVILQAVFGLDRGERLDAVRVRLAEMMDLGSRPLAQLPLMQTTLGRRSAARFFALRDEVDELLFALIAERRADAAERSDVLAMLIAARHEDGSPMSREEIRDELMTMLVAGHETTASELAWAFERLCREPEALGRLVAEVDSGDEDTYLTAVVHETLRRRPVLPHAAPRLVKQEIEVGGWRYPAGVSLVANGYLLHHDPEVYPEPYAFRPERFLDEAPGTYTWIPFGGGRRRCIGASFAMLEMRTVLRVVLRASEVRAGMTGAEFSRRRSITLSPRRGAPVVLRERHAVAA